MGAYLRDGKFIAGLLAIILGSAATGGAALLPIADMPPETISGVRASGQYRWEYGFDIGFENGQVNVELRIGLTGYDPGPGLVAVWENSIEHIWGRGFEIIDGPLRYPVNIDVVFVTGPGEAVHQTVSVVEGSGRANMLRWYSESLGASVAHEAGHMLGLYDEYSGGARALGNGIIDSGSIMGSAGGVVRERHYGVFVDWLGTTDGASRRSLIVPEPPMILLICLGISALRTRRSR